MGTDYNDLMTANPYHTFDPNRPSYGFQPSMLIDVFYFILIDRLIFFLKIFMMKWQPHQRIVHRRHLIHQLIHHVHRCIQVHFLLPQLQQPQLLLLGIMQHQYHMEYLHHLIMDKKLENRKRQIFFSSFECAYMFIISVSFFFFLFLVTSEKYIIYCDALVPLILLEYFDVIKKKKENKFFDITFARHMTANECVSM